MISLPRTQTYETPSKGANITQLDNESRIFDIIYLISTGNEKNTAAGLYALTKASIDTIASFMKSIT